MRCTGKLATARDGHARRRRAAWMTWAHGRDHFLQVASADARNACHRHGRRYTARHAAAAPHQALPRLRRDGRVPHPRRRQPRARGLHRLRHRSTTKTRSTWSARVPVWDDQVLLCRRNIEPRYGLWTLAGRLHGARRDHRGRRLARDRRRGRRAHRTAGPVHAAQRRARSARCTCSTARALLDTDFAPGPETHRGAAVRRRRGAVGRSWPSAPCVKPCSDTSTTDGAVNSRSHCADIV